MPPQPDESDDKQNRMPTWWRIPAGLTVGIGVALALAQTGAGQSVMRETGLDRPAASYTALSFTDPMALPTHLPIGHFSTDVSFTLGNASQTTNHYQWTIRFMDDKRVTSIATGQATVQGGGTINETKTVAGLCHSGKLKIVVSLAAPAEAINYTASCGG